MLSAFFRRTAESGLVPGTTAAPAASDNAVERAPEAAMLAQPDVVEALPHVRINAPAVPASDSQVTREST